MPDLCVMMALRVSIACARIPAMDQPKPGAHAHSFSGSNSSKNHSMREQLAHTSAVA